MNIIIYDITQYSMICNFEGKIINDISTKSKNVKNVKIVKNNIMCYKYLLNHCFDYF